MDFGKSDQALNSKCRDIDLNIPYLEDLNSNDANQFSPLIRNNTQSIQEMNITAANDENNQVHPDGSIFLANSFTGVSDDDARQVHPMRFIDFLRVASYEGIVMRVRRRYRGRGRAHPTNPYRCCTNVHCRTRKTPKWRKGPLGPKTLCNACGIHFKKQLTSGGNGICTIIVYGGASASPFTYVPSGTAEGDYLNF